MLPNGNPRVDRIAPERGAHAPRLAPSRRSAEQRLDERVGVERLEVVDRLADADELDREVDRLADGDDDAPLRGAVELGEDDARAADRLGEHLGLADRVLAVVGVEHEQGLVWRPRELALE